MSAAAAGGLRARLRPEARQGPLVPLLVSLTFLTGVVDAVSYLRLGHVFVANMTGNIVFLGFALAGAGGLSVASSLIALGAFLAGALAGGSIGARLGAHRGRLLRGAGVAQTLLVAAALAVASIAVHPAAGGARYAITALLAGAMGIQNAAAGRLGVPELTTTVLTKTLTGLASDVAAVGHGESGLHTRRLIAVGAMLLGAFAGGLLVLHASIVAALALACGLAACVALVAHLVSRGSPGWAHS